jgi:hypothetical protein
MLDSGHLQNLPQPWSRGPGPLRPTGYCDMWNIDGSETCSEMILVVLPMGPDMFQYLYGLGGLHV